MFRSFVVACLAWAAVLALAAGSLGVAVDVGRLLWVGHPIRVAVAGALVAGALALVLALVLAPLLAALAALGATLWRQRIATKLLAPLPLALTATAAGWLVTSVRHAQDPSQRAGLVAATTLGFLICGLATVQPRWRLPRMGALVIAGTAFVLDMVVPRWYYREIHDLLALLTMAGAVALIAPWRQRLVRRAARLGAEMAGLTTLAVSWLLLVSWAVPGWRPAADRDGQYGAAFARGVRAVFDLDRDGFSALAWGGDCDDFDASRNPFALDPPGGGDSNCNGIDPPANPTDAERGLAPPLGDANLAPGTADLVILLTVDALRNEVVRPDAMPALSALAARGVRLERTYSAGTRTIVVLPLVQRGGTGGLLLSRRFAAADAATSLIVGGCDEAVVPVIATGFSQVKSAPDRWSGRATAQLALAEIDRVGRQRHYLWLHLYDAHTPYPAAAQSGPLPRGLAASYRHYLAGVAAVDEGIDVLVRGLEARGRMETSVLIVTGDHGEGFGEHGILFHATSTYEALARVPAVLVAPGLSPSRYSQLAAHADLYPTILGAFGLARPEDERWGRSWLRLRSGTSAPLREFAFVRSAHAASGGEVVSPMMAIVLGRYKLSKTLEDNLMELYDVVSDPDERVDLLPREPDMARRLEHAAELYRDLVGYPNTDDRTDLRNFRGGRVEWTW